MGIKVKADNIALKICSIVFLCVGGVFLLLGLIFSGVGIGVEEVVFSMLGMTFAPIGVGFIVAGLICLGIMLRKTKRIKEIVAEGYHIMAKVASIDYDYTVRVNGRGMYRVLCSYEDESGVVHFFRSRILSFDPAALLKENEVAVYVRPNDFKYYYVDIDSILPQTIQH